MAEQKRAELEDREPRFGDKERDSRTAFLTLRKNIVSKAAPHLPPLMVAALAERTRGMRQDDIRAAVRRFQATGALPDTLSHPSNTCDPLTGNWCENLMDPHRLLKVLRNSGFEAQVLCGYYAFLKGSGIKSLLQAGCNAAISLLGRKGLALSPYYVLYGKLDKT